VIERDHGVQDDGRATGVQGDLEPLDEGPAGPTDGAEAGDAATSDAATSDAATADAATSDAALTTG
jgi:hypothetical protein